MNYWLVKSEPAKYSWDRFESDQQTVWDGIRNYAARNNLRDMKLGDQCLFYHSNEGKEIVGIAKVVKESFQDPGTTDPAWLAVELAPLRKLKKPLSLASVKADPELAGIELVRLSRLSVSKVSKDEFKHILSLTE